MNSANRYYNLWHDNMSGGFHVISYVSFLSSPTPSIHLYSFCLTCWTANYCLFTVISTLVVFVVIGIVRFWFGAIIGNNADSIDNDYGCKRQNGLGLNHTAARVDLMDNTEEK